MPHVAFLIVEEVSVREASPSGGPSVPHPSRQRMKPTALCPSLFASPPRPLTPTEGRSWPQRSLTLTVSLSCFHHPCVWGCGAQQWAARSEDPVSRGLGPHCCGWPEGMSMGLLLTPPTGFGGAEAPLGSCGSSESKGEGGRLLCPVLPPGHVGTWASASEGPSAAPARCQAGQSIAPSRQDPRCQPPAEATRPAGGRAVSACSQQTPVTRVTRRREGALCSPFHLPAPPPCFSPKPRLSPEKAKNALIWRTSPAGVGLGGP